jgi:hypothetical protein
MAQLSATDGPSDAEREDLDALRRDYGRSRMSASSAASSAILLTIINKRRNQ